VDVEGIRHVELPYNFEAGITGQPSYRKSTFSYSASNEFRRNAPEVISEYIWTLWGWSDLTDTDRYENGIDWFTRLVG
jgi:hypothetical protein